MARLVLTHVEPRGGRIAAGLRDAGHETVLLAFSRLVAVRAATDELARLDLAAFHRIVVVSPSTARFAARARPGPWPEDAMLAAVGPGTGEALADAGIVPSPERVETPAGDRHDADALLELPSLREGDARRVLVLAGNGGRRDWAETLARRGFDVHRIELYRRESIEPNEDQWRRLAQWSRLGEPPVFVVTTVDAVDRMMAGLAARGIDEWARSRTAFCPHHRIATRLEAVGWRDARVPGAGRRLVDAAIESGLAGRGDRKR